MKDDSTAVPVLKDEYLILPCPSCEHDVKVPTDSLGVRMGCPYCRKPLEVAEYEPVVEEVVDKNKTRRRKDQKPIERQPLVFRLLREDDLGVDTNREFADEFERRRLPSDAPEWDDESLLKKEQDRDDSGDGKAPAKKLLTRKEQIFRTITIVIMSASAVVAAMIAYAAIIKMTSVVRTDGQTLKELPAEVQGKIAAVREEQKLRPVSAFLTSNEEQAAVALITNFLRAKTNEDRLPFVRDPERVAPLMEEFYSREGILIEWPDGEAVRRDKMEDQGRYFIRLAIEFVGIGYRYFAVEQTKDDFRLDWETAVGYQAMPLEQFKSQRPKTPTPFRVKMKTGDYYNYQFLDREKYQAVALSYPGNEAFQFTGYIDRSSDWGVHVIKMLEAGEAPSVVAELSFPEDTAAERDDTQVKIDSIIADSWWL